MTQKDHDAKKQRLISEQRNLMWPNNRKLASTLIPVPRLATDSMLFEIDAVVVTSKAG